MSDMEKFLTPESMLTPGLAGGMTMGITNALAFQFGLIAPGPADKPPFFRPWISTK